MANCDLDEIGNNLDIPRDADDSVESVYDICETSLDEAKNMLRNVYICHICLKTCSTNNNLVAHLRTHTGERPFVCSCQRTFTNRSALVKHSKSHSPDGTKRFVCEVCWGNFTDAWGLKKHMRIHTGERPYVCNFCDKTYATSSTLATHKRMHTGERPHRCEICGKSFFTKSHLATHARQHSGVKPFECGVCHKAFTDGSSYRRHVKLHNGEIVFPCDACGKSYKLLSELNNHMENHDSPVQPLHSLQPQPQPTTIDHSLATDQPIVISDL